MLVLMVLETTTEQTWPVSVALRFGFKLVFASMSWVDQAGIGLQEETEE